MKLLEDEADLFGAVADHLVFAEVSEGDAVHDDAAGVDFIEPAENVDERGLARAGWTHKRYPFGGFHVEAEGIESAQGPVFLDTVLDHNLCRRCLLLGQNVDRSAQASPRKTDAGRML